MHLASRKVDNQLFGVFVEDDKHFKAGVYVTDPLPRTRDRGPARPARWDFYPGPAVLARFARSRRIVRTYKGKMLRLASRRTRLRHGRLPRARRGSP